MNPSKVLVISDRATGDWLAERLSPGRFVVSSTRPGAGVMQALRNGQPQVVVLDGIHARPGMAQMEVALLKEKSPGAQIIARSDEPSEADGDVIEQGIFCYLGGCSLEELLRVIEAAALTRTGELRVRPTQYEPRSST